MAVVSRPCQTAGTHCPSQSAWPACLPLWGGASFEPAWMQSSAAEFILQERPGAVVVETAVDEEHGMRTGNIMRLADLRLGRQGPHTSLAFQLAAASLETAMSTCRQLAERQMPPEQLTYAAALASGSTLVYGDVPKLATIRRLWEDATLQELDAHFGRQAAANFSSLLQGIQQAWIDLRSAPANAAGTSTDLPSSDNARRGEAVDATQGSWSSRQAKQPGYQSSSKPHRTGHSEPSRVPPADPGINEATSGRLNSSSTVSDGGVKRALLERMLGLAIPEELALALCQQALGSLHADAVDTHRCCYELYGTSRMLLASLELQELMQVCDGWQCNIWHILDPIRRLRPSQGGRGFDWEVLYELRCLNFEL
ncbi:hypothetical protein WJX84_002064 [Apatococcus fuscideae]|uniref:Uncharacterized protein n=1 Tax=Apatococcus fuscideae TaxID=2026836 RepID=A0AAW1T2C7_9CHLO